MGVSRRRVRAARLDAGAEHRPDAGARTRRRAGKRHRGAVARLDARAVERVIARDFASAPDAWIVDWLAALGHSGHPVTWSGSPPAVAISAAALVDPQGGARIDVAAPAGESVALRDAAGPLDSLRIANLGASVTTPLAAGSIGGVARAGAQSFSTTAPPLASIRPILVVGGAGWEGSSSSPRSRSAAGR